MRYTIPHMSEALLAELHSLLLSVKENTYSAFYRKHLSYGVPATLTEQLWIEVPFLQRGDITSCPFWDRVFVSREDVQVVRATGGTSTRTPMTVPRRTFGSYDTYVTQAGATRQLSFILPWFMSEQGRRTQGLMHINSHQPQTPEDFAYAAALARVLRADALYGFPQLLVSLAPYMSDDERKKINVIELVGERCSRAQRIALLTLYPRSRLYQNYAASEWRGVFGHPCEQTLTESSLAFHIDPTYFVSEFINPETGASVTVEELVQGAAELVLSSRTFDQPFPLVRYRTGDLLRMSSEECPCGGGALFEVAGRAASDRFRLFPYVIPLIAFEDVLSVDDRVSSDFEAHCFEIRGDIPRWRIELKVRPQVAEVSLENLAKEYAERLVVAAGTTYADAVKNGQFEPLTVSVLTEPVYGPSGKRIRLVQHCSV